ncbi:MAG: TonB-dependent receptor [Bacteroidota bacterium]
MKKQITGTVKDSIGVLPGANIRVKGTNTATATDVNGRFILDVPDDGAVLIISMTGYQTQEIPVKDRLVFNVILKEDSKSLEEVVVVAFGKQKKTDVIGAVTSVTPSDLRVPSSNLTTALAGRIAGIIGYQRSGEPGADNAAFFIRGVTTFGYKKDPLILIDGVELSTTELARLQTDDIASFSILKDATATALYGARGANGVILIGTKVGKVGKAKINLRMESNISSPTRNVELADPITYMKLANEAVLTRDPGGATLYSQQKIDNTNKGINSLYYPANDWRKILFKDNTVNQKANFNVSGGGDVAQYYIAGTYNNDHGVLKANGTNNFNNNIDLKSYALRSTTSINVTKSTEVTVRLYGTFDDYTGPLTSGAQMYRNVTRSNPVLFPATYPVDDAHQFTQHIMFGNAFATPNTLYLNPYAEEVRGYQDQSKSLMLAQFEIKQNLSAITEGLSFRAMGNTNREGDFSVSRSYMPFFYQPTNYDKNTNIVSYGGINPDTGTEYLDYTEGPKTVKANLYIESALNYNRTFAKKNNVSGLLIYQMRSFIEGNASSLQKSLPSRNLGLSGRATYSYDNRYFGEFNFGYNGSERFYETERFGFFPSAGIAWYASNEKFMQPLKSVISKLKFRATYGLVGNDAIGSIDDRFFYLSDVDLNNTSRAATFGTDNGYTRNGVLVKRYDNKDITWERSKQMNLGVELTLFDKFDFQADYFTQNRDNILMTRASVPTTMGLSAVTRANVGKASSAGIDASLDYTQNFNSSFWVTAHANFTYATSKFKVYEEPQYKDKNLSRIGNSLSQTFGYIAERLFIDDKDVANSPPQNFGIIPKAGDIKYVDVNGDGVITTLDKAPIGYPTDPEIVYGFGFSSGYKNFDVSAFFQGSAHSSFFINSTNGNGIGGSTEPFITTFRYDGDTPNGVVQNQLLKAYADSHWSEDNRNIYALYPRLSNTANANNDQVNTWFMRNGAFMRLKSVEIGYKIPKKIISKLKFESMRLYASGTNLLTLSGFKLWDVEQAENGLGYPVQKVFNFGINVTF